MVEVTDDFCGKAAFDIMGIIETELLVLDDQWIAIYDKVVDLLVDKFESNGYVNHN